MAHTTRQVVGGLLLVLALLEVCRVAARPLQCNRESARLWVDQSTSQWALKNGFAMGVAVSTRLGYWCWYALPFGVVVSGSAVYGCAAFGIYGFVRGTVAPLALLALMLRRDYRRVASWLLDRRSLSCRLSGALLATTALFVFLL